MLPFPSVRPGDPVALSATAYVAGRRCPELAGARLRGEYGSDSEAAFRGGLSHRIFARHLRSGPIDDSRFELACKEEIGAGLNAKVVSLGLRPSQINQVIERVGELYDRFKRLSADGLVAAELMIEAHPADGVRLHGAIDAVFADAAGLRLVDWKTGAVGDEVVDQMAFYSLLWALDRGALPDFVEAVSVETGHRVTATPTVAEVEQTAERVAELVDRLRGSWSDGEVLPRRAGGWCRFCPVAEGCPEGKSALRVLASA